MIYKEIKNLSKYEIISYIESDQKDKIIEGLLSLFMNNIDKSLAIKYSNLAMTSDDLEIKKIGIIGMGHIARVYGLKNISDFNDNIKKIEKLNNSSLISLLNDAKDDFSIYIK